MNLSGEIVSDQILKLRFANGGRISYLNYKLGQTVNKGQLLAQLNQKEMQTYLDRALKQYEKVRADFEEKQKKDLSEFDRVQVQAGLDISVKNVELAKQNLDATNLYAPIAGVVIESDPVAVGMNITPAALSIVLVDPASLYFATKIKEGELKLVREGQEGRLKLRALGNKIFEAKVERIGFAADKTGKYPVVVALEKTEGLRLGLTGKLALKK